MSQQEKILERVRVLSRNYEHIVAQMGDPVIASDPEKYQQCAKQHRELEPIIQAFHQYDQIKNEVDEYQAILAEKASDPELVEMAKEELSNLEGEVDKAFLNLQRLLLPKDPLDGKNVIFEVRAGTGGEEASLFASEMFRAYLRYAETQGWKVEVSHTNETGLGGLKEATAVIEGKDVYSRLKYESGTHRVQRVPETETQGRVHTSAITVAIMPEAEEVDVEIKDSDLRIDTYRSSGAGGQHVNTTDSAIRITHNPTGIVVTCQDEKSQHKNKEKAMRVLRSHLYEIKLKEQHDQMAADRKSQVGSGDRSEKIRTYNFPQGRVTDHRIKHTLYQLDGFMNGDMDDMINACRTYYETQRIQDQFSNPA